MRTTIAAAAALASVARAATTTSAYTDETTGITFQRWQDASTGFAFGVALPENPEATTDIIGQIVSPGAGWAGVSMTSSMMASTLIAAWPNGDDIVASARKTNAYSNPAAMADVTLTTIPEGTFVNSTHYSYTFLCKGCVTGDSGAFDVTTTTAVLGWAFSKTAPTTPGSADSVLNYHAAGFGAFGMPIADAESAEFETWAKLATATSGGSSTTTGSNSTTTPGSATTPVSTPLSTPTTLNVTYDYIVVGGGAAGLVAAGRLAETKKSVLLIERGGASTKSSGGTDTLDWNNTVTPYDVPAYGYAVDQTGDVSYCTDTASQAGCILGGSSSINAEMFVKPQEADFENWPEGWSWADVESSAQAFYERNPGTTLPSKDGRRYNQGVYETLSKLFTANGWSEVDAIEEPNKKEKVFSHPPWNVKDSLRAGPVLTYLPAAQELDNFNLQLNSKVVRVIRSGSAITGVEVQTDSGATQIINLTSNGKVVLAAGALSTPRILFNSGIGPADQLEIVANANNGIELDSSDYIELPVGKGLKDHPILSMTVNVAGGNMTVFDPTNPSENDIALYKQGSGPLAEGMQRLNFWTSVEGSDGKTRYVQGTTSVSSSNAIKVKVYLTHGLTSTGRLGIDASGATTLMTQPWLNTDADKEAITSFLNEFFGYVQKSGTLSVTSTTGGNVTAADLIAKLTTGSHFVGTAKMGTDSGLENDGTSVVDTDCKVYGTDNLYVVDASIHPDLPTGNTQAIVYVAAEHAAKKIAGQTTTISTGSSSGSSSGSASSQSSAVASSASSNTGSSSGSESSGSESSGSESAVAESATTSTTVAAAATTPAPESGSGSGSGSGASTVTTTVTVKNTKMTTVYVTVAAGEAASTPAVAAVANNNGNNNVGAANVQTSTYTQVAAAAASSTFATQVVAAEASVASSADASPALPTIIASGIASNWTNIIPSAALTQVIPQPTGLAGADHALPEGTRIKDVLEWFTFVFESVVKGALRK
ncbi:Glucose-methanol-choline oxidoreductase [Lasiodiplodia theobromae]|uniref:Cellobiose dehydrogenase n=1 Tax=Lasiodiplodia theobromae TaxID=45133 RepID=A0A5N5D2F1_9PEZI|nr:Cellobiose dehydrogenase [Lasiodiplodia theobromae]KAB2571514.1 Cellobiose dehydrogenase [Lasiodiplodia theobromae]KAF4536103.1 Cellobiose dehydrogenase [Lasiodiplodia theobromae]KAF9634362.1 Glucose-methanol-choline oxidoreductase [Lasiodiplodia theobromae]